MEKQKKYPVVQISQHLQQRNQAMYIINKHILSIKISQNASQKALINYLHNHNGSCKE